MRNTKICISPNSLKNRTNRMCIDREVYLMNGLMWLWRLANPKSVGRASRMETHIRVDVKDQVLSFFLSSVFFFFSYPAHSLAIVTATVGIKSASVILLMQQNLPLHSLAQQFRESRNNPSDFFFVVVLFCLSHSTCCLSDWVQLTRHMAWQSRVTRTLSF